MISCSIATVTDSVFFFTIITDELGGAEFRKPNETAFRQMAEALAAPFERMVYIGDNLKKDFMALFTLLGFVTMMILDVLFN